MKISWQSLHYQVKQYVAESPSTRDPLFFWYILKVRGLKSLKKLLWLGKLYDAEFFADHEQLKVSYEKLAELIYEWYTPSSVCDMGCGNGFIIQFLAQRGVQICGIEGSPEALKFIHPSILDRVVILDLTRRQKVGTYDLVISTEVAEHVPKRYSDALIDNVTHAARQNILFTAAQPGQWGDGHINCQPREFWIDLFAQHGWRYDKQATESFTDKAKAIPEITSFTDWLISNFMLFAADNIDTTATKH